jgi:hypothetical protein
LAFRGCSTWQKPWLLLGSNANDSRALE